MHITIKNLLKGSKERQGPTQGVRLTEVSVKGEFTVLRLRINSL